MARIFISHTGKDRAWAEWARWHLQAAGYATELDSVDRPAGTSFIEAMHRALARTNPLLILLSAAYLDPGSVLTVAGILRLCDPGLILGPQIYGR